MSLTLQLPPQLVPLQLPLVDQSLNPVRLMPIPQPSFDAGGNVITLNSEANDFTGCGKPYKYGYK